MEDTLWQGLTDMLAGVPMGITAENLAEKYDITREQCDQFAILSQQRWGFGKPGLKITTSQRTMTDQNKHLTGQTSFEN